MAKKKKTTRVIDRVIKENYFLSNFYPCTIEYGGLIYACAEAAFQAQKVIDDSEKEKFVGLFGSQAKYLGRKAALRPDWEEVKVDIMKNVLYAKFTQNEDLKQQLIATEDAELIEKNWWGDQFWGVCGDIGENKLGILLMELRKELTESGV